ncbi:hypothetical protein MUN46_005415 [Mesosutterella sp. AGMB02718]|uniref:Uncharacterized protein n=1 Tax=Mesosutterella faecium TaxID=2925194 RepID=A0ABT7ILX8_9BURK|nr:hypothetical protein [Mesosutterella sp. AGMB02718]MDL2059369.1 hypothetical protein [Mesosutterella sp. AGMB02718]
MHSTIREAVGLQSFSVQTLTEATREKPVAFCGYFIRYRCLDLGSVKVSLGETATKWNEDGTPSGFKETSLSFGIQSDSFWHFVSQSFVLGGKDPSSLYAVWIIACPLMERDTAGSSIPLTLLHDNVMGPIMPWDELTVQVSFIAASLKIIPKSQLGGPLSMRASFESVKTAFSPAPLCQIRAPMIKWDVRPETETALGRVPGFFHAWAATPFGCLEVFYTAADSKEMTQLCKTAGESECVLEAEGWLVGDVATGRFRNSLILDEAHDLRLLAVAQAHRAYKPLHAVFTPDISLNVNGKLQAQGVEPVLDWLRANTDYKKNTSLASRCAYVRRRNPQKNTTGLGIGLVDAKEQNICMLFEGRCDPAGRIDRLEVSAPAPEDIDMFLGFSYWTAYPGEFSGCWVKKTSREQIDQAWKGMDPGQFDDLASTEGDFWEFRSHDRLTEEPLVEFIGTSDAASDCIKAAIEASTITENMPGGMILLDAEDRPGLSLPARPSDETAAENTLNVEETVPVLPGQIHSMEVRASFLPKGCANGELALLNELEPNAFACFVPGLSSFAHSFAREPGFKENFELFGLAFDPSIRDTEPLLITEGPLYEMDLKNFLEQNPGKTKADFKGAKVLTDQMVILSSSETSCWYSFTGPVLSVSDCDLFGTPLYSMVTPISKSGARDFLIRLYANKKAFKKPVKAGDSISCALWLLARMPRKQNIIN